MISIGAGDAHRGRQFADQEDPEDQADHRCVDRAEHREIDRLHGVDEEHVPGDREQRRRPCSPRPPPQRDRQGPGDTKNKKDRQTHHGQHRVDGGNDEQRIWQSAGSAVSGKGSKAGWRRFSSPRRGRSASSVQSGHSIPFDSLVRSARSRAGQAWTFVVNGARFVDARPVPQPGQVNTAVRALRAARILRARAPSPRACKSI